MIPNSSWQGTPLAPDQLFSAGFRDGMNGRATHPQFQDNTHYLKGYAEGCRSTTENPELTPFTEFLTLRLPYILFTVGNRIENDWALAKLLWAIAIATG